MTQRVKIKGLAKHVYKEAGRAINDYKMIEDKDRVLVGVSGGKDSLALLKVLQLRREHLPIDFSMTACYVAVDFSTTDRKRLEAHFKREDISYVIKELDLKTEDIGCFWCSWNKRKLLFETARDYSCNKVALAHHLDDIVETILMNLFFRGEVSSMRPRVDLFGGEVSIIRPFAYLEKKALEDFAAKVRLPDTRHSCPYASDSKRRVINEAVAKLYRRFPHVKTNIFRSLQRRNIKDDYLP
jgi:tRNA(Ile)-lysidine synthase TilS/MesJ